MAPPSPISLYRSLGLLQLMRKPRSWKASQFTVIESPGGLFLRRLSDPEPLPGSQPISESTPTSPSVALNPVNGRENSQRVIRIEDSL